MAVDNFGTEYVKQMMDMQKKMMEQYQENMQAMTKAVSLPNFSQATEYFNNSMKMMEKMWNFYGINNQDEAGTKTFADMFAQLQNTNKVYADLFSFWQELVGAMPLDTPEKLKKYVDKATELYSKTVIDVTKPFVPQQLQGVAENLMNFFTATKDAASSMIQPWVVDKDSFVTSFSNFLKGEPGDYDKYIKYAYDAYQQSFGRLFNVAGIGPSQEQTEEQFRTLDAFMKFAFECAEMGSKVLDLVRKNSQDILGKYGEMFNNENGDTNFKDFYTVWVRTNEAAFEKMFATEEFSKLFDDFAKSATDLKIRTDKVMESALAMFPIPTNATMDGLYKTVYTLRKQVAELQKQVKALSAAKAALAPAEKKTTK